MTIGRNHGLRRLMVAVGCAVLAGCGDEPTSAAGAEPGDRAADPVAVPPPPPPKPAPIVVQGVGLRKPESVVHDAKDDVYLVSNIDGKAIDKDGKGFISRISPDGKMLELAWISSTKKAPLHAPKGLAIVGDELYVVDVDTVRVYDRRSGESRRAIAIKGATFLNGITADPEGAVYVSDSGLEQWGPYVEPNGKDAIYRIVDGHASVLVQDKGLGNPNGLAYDAGGLLVATKPGEILRVGIRDGQRTSLAKLPAGTLDGLVNTGEALLVSSWDGRAVFAGGDAKDFGAAISRLESPAGIGYDAKRKRLLVPLLNRDAIEIHSL